jgi:hypothetical protein
LTQSGHSVSHSTRTRRGAGRYRALARRIISKAASCPPRRPAIGIFQCLPASCHQVARGLDVVAVVQATKPRPRSNRSANMLASDALSRDLLAPIQRWLKSKYGRKTCLISFGSETTLGCTAAHRAVVESPEPVPPPDERLVEIRHIAKSPRPGERAQVQCLGDMPWVSRATAMWPDNH